MRTKHSNTPGGHRARARPAEPTQTATAAVRWHVLTISRAALAIASVLFCVFLPAAKKGKKAKKAKKTKKKAAKKGQRQSGSEEQIG